MDTEPPEHVIENQRYWNETADQWVAPGERAWAQDEPTWGMWQVPNDERITLFPSSLDGLDCIELGCGTGYVSAWMKRGGAARVLGVDMSEKQLETAHRLAGEHGLELELRHGNAEAVDEPDASFDVAVSEYGAAIWCDPEVWVPEAHRLLRPGGWVAFLAYHPFAMACAPLDGSVPITERLEQDYFGLRRFDWRDAVDEPGGIEFCLTIGDWFDLFDRVGFDVVGYRELQAPAECDGTRFTVTADWAKRFPSEHIWQLRKRS